MAKKQIVINDLYSVALLVAFKGVAFGRRRFIIMRSPVQSRVPLLDKNKAFERLPLLGAFFFFSYGLRQLKLGINVKTGQSENPVGMLNLHS